MTRLLRILPTALFAAVVFSGCLVVPGPPEEGYGGPPLPAVVEFEGEPYYYYGGYHYYYRDNAWYYAHSRNGPWKPLPRERYPKETRFRHGRQEGGHERGEEHEEHVQH